MHNLVSNLHPILIAFIILLAKTLELSLSAIKTIFISKGKKPFAVLVGFIECAVWALIVSAVITSLTSNMLWLLGYCIGYCLGAFKLPESTAFDFLKKAGGESAYTIAKRVLKFRRNRKIYIFERS